MNFKGVAATLRLNSGFSLGVEKVNQPEIFSYIDQILPETAY